MTNSYVAVGASNFLFPTGSFIVLLLLGLGAALWLWSLIDALRTHDQTWKAAGQNKLVWIVVIILLGFLGAILYVVISRPALKRVPA